MSPLAFIEADFAKIIGCTPSPNRPDPLPETPAQPEHSTDSTGVITGNRDLPDPEWTGRTEPEERAPLPIYPLRAVSSAHVQAWVDAQLARVDGDFDALDAYARSIHGRMYRDGLLPDRRKEVRS